MQTEERKDNGQVLWRGSPAHPTSTNVQTTGPGIHPALPALAAYHMHPEFAPNPPAHRLVEMTDDASDQPQESQLTGWVAAAVILLISLAAGFLLWAKVSSTWPIP